MKVLLFILFTFIFGCVKDENVSSNPSSNAKETSKKEKVFNEEVLSTIFGAVVKNKCPYNGSLENDKSTDKFLALPNILILNKCKLKNDEIKSINYMSYIDGEVKPVAVQVALKKAIPLRNLRNYLSLNESNFDIYEDVKSKLPTKAIINFGKESQWSSSIVYFKGDSNESYFNAITFFPKLTEEEKIKHKIINSFAEVIRFYTSLNCKKIEFSKFETSYINVAMTKKLKNNDELVMKFIDLNEKHKLVKIGHELVMNFCNK